MDSAAQTVVGGCVALYEAAGGEGAEAEPPLQTRPRDGHGERRLLERNRAEGRGHVPAKEWEEEEQRPATTDEVT